MIDWPASPTPGQIFNSTTGGIYIWDGVAWSLVTQATATAERRNRIVNPCMQVSQEYGNTALNVPANYPADQWSFSVSGTGVGSHQRVQLTTPKGATDRLRCTVTTADASLTGGDAWHVTQPIEGQMVADFQWGTANAKQAVLRFGFKGPAGTYSARVMNGAGNRSYVAQFTISAAQAGADTEQIFVIPGDTTGTWPVDNSLGWYVGVCLACGPTYQGAVGWQAGVILGTSANSNGLASTSNVFELFDVGLYADPNKTGLPPQFEVPDLGTELARCQRYWEAQYHLIGGYNAAGGVMNSILFHKVAMRQGPTVAFTTPAYSNGSGLLVAGQNTPNSVGVSYTITAVGGAFASAVVVSNARM
jgi:hypothetical protein